MLSMSWSLSLAAGAGIAVERGRPPAAAGLPRPGEDGPVAAWRRRALGADPGHRARAQAHRGPGRPANEALSPTAPTAPTASSPARSPTAPANPGPAKCPAP